MLLTSRMQRRLNPNRIGNISLFLHLSSKSECLISYQLYILKELIDILSELIKCISTHHTTHFTVFIPNKVHEKAKIFLSASAKQNIGILFEENV